MRAVPATKSFLAVRKFKFSESARASRAATKAVKPQKAGSTPDNKPRPVRGEAASGPSGVEARELGVSSTTIICGQLPTATAEFVLANARRATIVQIQQHSPGLLPGLAHSNSIAGLRRQAPRRDIRTALRETFPRATFTCRQLLLNSSKCSKCSR